MTPMRLLALVPKRLGVAPGQRFRLEQWAPRLRAHHDIAIDFLPFESPRLGEIIQQRGRALEKAARLLVATWRRRRDVARARDYDGVIIYREAAALGPAFFERWLARRGVPIYYDFDDAIWLRDPGSVNPRAAWLRFPGKVATVCRLARAVIVGNQHLAAWARGVCPPARVHVVPTTIELDRYPAQPEPASDAFVITWSGTQSTLHHLEGLRPVLEALGRRRRVVLRVISHREPPRFAGVATEYVPWCAAREAEDVGSAHVGIMPLPDDEFARGKCACKALQYMATGRAVVVSPVGVNVDIVRHRENGLVARTHDEWVAALDELAGSPELRARLGQAARATVTGRFSAEIGAAIFARVVRGAGAVEGRA